MTKQRDLKRLVRERMLKTGEAYTAARARILEKRSRPAPKTSADWAPLAGMSDAAVAKKTGRTWREWVATLDRVEAAQQPHRWIAAWLQTKQELPGWWAQMVAVGYERIRGLREPGQRRDGRFDVSKSKVYPVPLEQLWKGFLRCERWLGDTKLRMSKATKLKSMRLKHSDGTPIDVHFYAKGAAKSQVQLQHGNLATREEAERLRGFWSERLAALGEVLRQG